MAVELRELASRLDDSGYRTAGHVLRNVATALVELKILPESLDEARRKPIPNDLYRHLGVPVRDRLSEMLDEARRGWRDFGPESSVSSSAVKQILSGKTNPKITTLWEIANELGKSRLRMAIAYWLSWEDPS